MKKTLCLISILIFCLALCSCGSGSSSSMPDENDSAGQEPSSSRYLSFVDDEPNTMDPQCTSEYYTIPLNVFDRLVEVEAEGEESSLVPSLADSWEISGDGLVYTFHLHPEVKFSNGSPLTSEDVQFTLERLLTNPNSQNQDLAMSIKGAAALRSGQADTLEGFRIVDDLTFEITLESPFAPFLAALSTPGASILDRESTLKAGENFGRTPEDTIGTGGFIPEAWIKGERILLKANPNCWSGAPSSAGLNMSFLGDTISQRTMFDEGRLDLLDLEQLGPEAEYFIHGDIYRRNLFRGPRVGITYIALNESVEPLNDVRVRKALQLALDRETLMKAMTGGRGNVENGIFPYGLLGHNSELEPIPFAVSEAQELLAEAGYEDGFDLDIYCTESSYEKDRDLYEIIAFMWGEAGVRTQIVPLDSNMFMTLRKQGALTCYTSTWSADYDDPDNFIYTFFGTEENSLSRSLCYDNPEIMERVRQARSIVDEEERIREYQELEKIIVQEDAAWIPLYSSLHLVVVNERVEGFKLLWNGWSSNNYEQVAVSDTIRKED